LIYNGDSRHRRHNIYGLTALARTTCPPSPSISSLSPASPISRARCRAVCQSVWGYTTDDISDDLFSDADHAFLDTLDEANARIFAAEAGYDLVDDNGMLTDWWGFCWMILAEKRGLLTPENRAAARAAIEEKYMTAPNVIGVIVGR
jgi:hypothetical protein